MTKNLRELKSIGEIIPLAIKKIGQEKIFGKYFVMTNWEKIVGREVASNSFVSALDRGKLILKVRNSVWSHHLMMLKKEIIKKVNDYYGKKIVNDIWFMAGYKDKSQNYNIEENKVNKKSDSLPELNESEISAAKIMVKEISNVKIRNKIIEVVLKNMAFKKAKEANDWPRCLNCEVLIEPGEKYCTICRINESNTAKNKIHSAQQILKELPWLNFVEIKKYLDLSKEEYIAAKKNLAAYYINLIFKENGAESWQTDLTMLLKEIKPENLNQECIDEVMAEIKKRFLKTGRGNYVFTFGS